MKVFKTCDGSELKNGDIFKIRYGNTEYLVVKDLNDILRIVTLDSGIMQNENIDRIGEVQKLIK